MTIALTSGFLLGIMSSFHCLGMCGPIALSLPVHHLNKYKKTIYLLLYNFGRVVTYSLLGLVFGLLGKSLFIGKYQQIFSVVIGILLLLAWFIPKLFIALNNQYIIRFNNFIRQKLANLFKQEKSKSVYFLIGIFNGLLPCGLVYLALASALISGSLANSISFMLMFGIATIPIMFAIAFFGNFISLRFRRIMNRMIPFFIIIMAVLLILRGLNLGIPYISPALEHTAQGTEQSCCHKE